MTKKPDKPKKPVCIYCWEPIDLENSTYGYTSEYGDGPQGYWHWECRQGVKQPKTPEG